MTRNDKPLVGRPPIVIDAAQLEKLAARWLTREAAADIIGCTRQTLYNRMREDPSLEAAWHRGRAMLQANTMDWLIEAARKGSVRAQMFLAERVVGLDGKANDVDAATEKATEFRDAIKAMVLTEIPASEITVTTSPAEEDEHQAGEIDAMGDV